GREGQVARQVAYSRDLGRLLCLGGERRGEKGESTSDECSSVQCVVLWHRSGSEILGQCRPTISVSRMPVCEVSPLTTGRPAPCQPAVPPARLYTPGKSVCLGNCAA